MISNFPNIYHSKPISEILQKGLFMTDITFNQHPDNLHRLAQYIEQMNPSVQNFKMVLKLIKFYRFPIAICFRHLYEKLKEKGQIEIKQYQDYLEQIAAFVKVLMKQMKIQGINEVRFLMKWGASKKKFRIDLSEPQVAFGKYILELSLFNTKIHKEHKQSQIIGLEEKINLLLQKRIDRQTNKFEKHFENFIKNKAENLIKTQESEIQLPIYSDIRVKPNKNQQEFFEKYQIQQNSSKQYLCCRKYFLSGEQLNQPQNMRIEYKFFSFPFINNPNELPTKQQKIKRTLCGFTNSEGGIIYFGVKEDQCKKRIVYGNFFNQKKKLQFRNEISFMMESIKPDFGKKCQVKFVPIKNAQGNYLSGKYVAKVIVGFGSSDQVYSYQHRNVEKFIFKTENEFIQIKQGQQILKVYKDKLDSKGKILIPIHKGACHQPELGKPVFTITKEDIQKEEKENYNDQSEEEDKYIKKLKQKEDYYKEKIMKEKKKISPRVQCIEVNCKHFLVSNTSCKNFEQLVEKNNVKQFCESIREINSNNVLIIVEKEKDFNCIEKILPEELSVLKVYSRIKIQSSIQEETIKEIISTLKEDIVERSDQIIQLKDDHQAIQLYLKLKEGGIAAIFSQNS